METKNKIYLILIMFLLVALFLVVFLVYPLLKDISSTSGEILSDKSKTLFIDLQSTELNKFQTAYKDYQENFTKIDQLFVDSQDPVDFIKFLETTASDTNVNTDISLLPPPQGADATKLSSLSFEVDATGTFADLLKFSEKLETGPYLININSIIMKPASQDTTKSNTAGDLEADFMIDVVSK